MQPAAWPARDAQILERQSALLERIVADRASAMARAAAASQTEAQQGRRSPAAQTPRVRQIDLLTGEQWPAAPLPVVPPYTARATSVPHSGRQEVALPPLPPLPPRVRTRMPPSSPPAEEAGRVMAMPSWSTRPSTAAPGGSPRDPDVLGSPLDAAPGDYLCPISHEIMLNPVLIETGCTFERDALRRWWAQSGVPRCPLTGVVVQNAIMAPADELRRQIRAWALRSGVDLRAVAQERQRTAAADSLQQSQTVMLQPAGQTATAAATKPGKVKQAANKASKKGRGAARAGGGCCCCCRSGGVLE